MILLGEMAFVVVIIMLVGGIAMSINTEIQKRLQIRDLIREYTPKQIKELRDNVKGTSYDEQV